LDIIENEKHNIKLTGQLMALTTVPTMVLNPNPASGNQDHSNPSCTLVENASTWSWLWTGGYIKGRSTISGTDEVSQKIIIMNVPGHLTTILNPQIVTASTLPDLHLLNNELTQLNSQHLL
jgi:hypothetical protein